PFVIPEKLSPDACYFFGCFCSPNCALAYILDMTDAFVWDRYSLFRTLYKWVFKLKPNLVPAPSRPAFKRLGGELTHQAYIDSVVLHNKEYRWMMPPMIPINCYLEERKSLDQNLQVSTSRMLRRTKPLPHIR